MHKTASTALALLSGLALLAAPVALSIYVADRQAAHIESKKALSMADEVMRRTDEVGRQGRSAVGQLAAQRGVAPCSAGELALMRQLAIDASYLRALGRVRDQRLVCSSLGDHGAGFALGAPDYVSQRGVRMRVAVTLPLAPRSQFLVSELDGFAAIVHRDLIFDVSGYADGIALAVIGAGSGRAIGTRGPYRTSWLRPLAPGAAATFADGDFIVALHRAPVLDAVAVAAIPLAAVRQTARELTEFLLPVGVVAGLALSSGFFFLLRRQESLPALLRAALRRDEFFLMYQPILRLDSGACVGAEALLRWRRRDGKLIRPDLFIPIAEETGIITSITQRILALVEHDAPALVKAFPQLHVSVNFSSRDLKAADIVPQLRALIQRTGMTPANLMVEATERGLIDAARSGAILASIRGAGIAVAIDDFGTGYSSLSYLTQLPVDYLKIDKSFVDTIGTMAPTSSVVLHIIEMAKSLNLEMIAEGVETEAQAAFLRERGVQFAQGFLYARPMLADEFMRYMQAQAAELAAATRTFPV